MGVTQLTPKVPRWTGGRELRLRYESGRRCYERKLGRIVLALDEDGTRVFFFLPDGARDWRGEGSIHQPVESEGAARDAGEKFAWKTIRRAR